MICRLTGRVAAVGEDAVVIERAGLGYEVLVPTMTLGELHRRMGEELTLHTLQYFEGSPAGSHLIPRLIGFLTEPDRAFFNLLTRVKGISNRRALRVMSLPVHQLAAAVEHGDTRLLTSLPEVGKKTAAQIVADLRGKLRAFLEPSAAAVPIPVELTNAQRIAVDILVQWGDRRADAERWVAAAVEAESSLAEPDAIVRAAYRTKQVAGRPRD